MRICGHGVDLVHCARIARVLEQHGDRFITRIFTPREIEYCTHGRSTIVRLSGRFAVKEAVLKALGTGWRGGIEWTDIETRPDALGKPVVTLSGEALAMATRLGIIEIQISISHAGDYALASAIALGKD